MFPSVPKGEAINAVKAGADYLGVGAMFPTRTKPDAEFVSMEELEKYAGQLTYRLL